MPLLFSCLCDLLSDLESLFKRQSPLLATALRRETNGRINKWCKSLDLSVNSPNLDVVALLSTLFPKRRTDRVYGIQPRSLSRKLKRVLGLGNGRHQLLDRWQEAGHGDLGSCVERALRQAEYPIQSRQRQVTVEEIDSMLASVAAGYRFSAPKVRAAVNDTTEQDVDQRLGLLYRRLQSREAKWLTRVILKDYGSVEIPEWTVLRCIDHHLPIALKVNDNFEDAVRLLRGGKFQGDVEVLVPQIGVKVGRTTYAKARSVKHAVSMIRNRNMSVERKYDGEYCQIHVDLERSEDAIQIFSKSGKDSTIDRSSLHDTLRKCLSIGQGACSFTRKCILEGEMVIWSDRENEILPFHKIRKHVSRSGSFLGTDADSLPHHYEHLMIVFYDILLLDDSSCLQLAHAVRRGLLQRTVSQIPGRAELATNSTIDFSTFEAPEQLRKQYALAITNRWEGLVLKPSNEPYFGSAQRSPGDPPSCWLKLKKDYITGLGDTADFAVIGAGYCGKAASRCTPNDFRWTHFHIGCLKNRDAVIQLGAKPEYVVLDAIHKSLSTNDLRYLNQNGQFQCLEAESADRKKAMGLETASWNGPGLKVAFRKPFVFEIMGGGFDKPANSEFYALRWPRVLKIHHDRNWKDCVSLEELQGLAMEASTVPDEEDFAAEVERWKKKLDSADRGVRNVMLPWDDSQEQPELNHPNPISDRRRKRSTQLDVSPFIRIDTDEMSSEELHLTDGEVTRRPKSSGSMPSRASELSLPTPPTSSPAKKDQGVKPASSRIYPVTARPSDGKRPPEGPRDGAGPLKKFKHAVQNETVRPMQESSNSANRVRRPSPSITRSRPNPNPDAFLVHKLPPDVSGLPIKSRFKRPKYTVRALSPDRETTASERTSQTTSHPSQTFVHNLSPKIGVINDRRALQISANLVPATEKIPVDIVPKPQIPNFLKCPVMLSPCISRIPYLLENLLPGRVGDIVPLPQECGQEPLPTPPPTNPSSTPGAVLLIESKRHLESSQLMISTLPYLQHSPYERIEVWDWTILELIARRETDARRLGKRFFGSMWWDGTANEAKVQWSDGLLMRLRIEADKRAYLVQEMKGKVLTRPYIVESLDTKNSA